jgi:hypothetical protein
VVLRKARPDTHSPQSPQSTSHGLSHIDGDPGFDQNRRVADTSLPRMGWRHSLSLKETDRTTDIQVPCRLFRQLVKPPGADAKLSELSYPMLGAQI